MAKDSAIIAPNLGLYLGQQALTIPSKAVQLGENFRVKNGKLSNVNLGWELFSAIDFGNPIMLIETFFIRGAAQKFVVATTQDVFDYNQTNDTATYINRRYATGTVASTGTTVTGTGTNWFAQGIKIGDYIHFGSAAQTSRSVTWYRITAVDAGGTQLTIATTAGTVGAGAVYTIRRTLTGTTSDLFDSETFVQPDDGVGDDLFFLTNGVDYVLTWDGQASQMVSQSAMGFTCKRLAAFKNMMLYANLIYSGDFLPTTVINSDVGKPVNAGDTGTGLSEQFRTHDGVDQIWELEDLGDNMVVYSERHVVLMQFVGADLVFIFREAASGVGPIASNLIADFGDYHEFIGTDSQYLFDGVSVVEVGKQVFREVLRARDPTRQTLGFTHFDEENGDLLWLIPLTSDTGAGDEEASPEFAYVEHYLEEVGDNTPTPFSKRAVPFSCSGYSAVLESVTWDQMTMTWADLVSRWNEASLFAAFPLNLMGSTDGHIYKINTIQTGGGDDLVSFVRFGRRLCGDGRMRGLLARIYPFADQYNIDLEITARLCDHAAGPITTTETFLFDTTLPEEGHFVSTFRRGRFFEVEFGTDGDPWAITGYDVDVKHGGRR